ncbi:MAG: hypothetical protein JSW04_06905 [Desulfobacterales bacterium]|nr:MAG: hypothetical protein JSV38_08775 [Desulfobacterales bacterium]UCD91146.1 MAG: hypothetical protein JSW04_06905 [Desulfobacterales bacterium]
MEDKINGQPKYILCTKSKSQHRKAIEVCHQCPDRQSCDEYQQIQQPELVQALDKLMMAFNKKHIRPRDAATLKKALKELSQLCK